MTAFVTLGDELHHALPVYGPPTPIIRDGVVFFDVGSDCEQAWCGKSLIGESRICDETGGLIARKRLRPIDDFEHWRPMRSRWEARAYIVSGYRT